MQQLGPRCHGHRLPHSPFRYRLPHSPFRYRGRCWCGWRPARHPRGSASVGRRARELRAYCARASGACTRASGQALGGRGSVEHGAIRGIGFVRNSEYAASASGNLKGYLGPCPSCLLLTSRLVSRSSTFASVLCHWHMPLAHATGTVTGIQLKQCRGPAAHCQWQALAFVSLFRLGVGSESLRR